jgi:adenylate cyclase
VRIRLRTKITVALLLLAIAPLVASTVIVVSRNAELLERSAREYRLAAADTVTTDVRNQLAGASSELVAVGAAFSNIDLPGDERIRLAESLLRGTRWLPTVRLFSKDGEHVHTLTTDGVSPEPPQTLAESLRRVAETENVAFEAVRTGPNGKAFLPLVVPVIRADNNELYAYVWSVMELSDLSRSVANTSARRFGEAEDRVWIVDDQLRMIAHADPRRILTTVDDDPAVSGVDKGSNHLRRDVARTEEYTRAGIEILGALVPIPEIGWGVVVEQLREDAYAAVETTRMTAMQVGAVALALAVLMGLFLGHRLAAPVLKLATAARQIATGAFDTRVAIETTDEVGELAGTFNTMAKDLDTYEKRVVEETRIRTDLSRYLSSDVVDSIVDRKESLNLGGERRECTILFADIVSFTPLAEKHDAEHLVSVLNELFTFMTEIVHRNGGIIDKFMGDCVMAVFGTPRSHDDDAARAVRSAEEMMHWLEVGNARWRKELGAPLQLAIGISTGVVLAGNIGSEKRMEYTVIGDAVNLAARLESIAMGGQVLVSEHTARRAGDELDLVSIGTRKVKGKEEEVEVFCLQD